METLTLELLDDAGWRDAAELSFYDPAAGADGQCTLFYDVDYAIERMLATSGPAEIGRGAIASRFPVDVEAYSCSRWPAILDDIRPGGSAERWWARRLGMERRQSSERDFPLLAQGTIAPVGHLRIKEAVPEKRWEPPRFPVDAVVARTHGFIDYAAEIGAAVGGATGAGGEAPKLLLRVEGAFERVWLDTWQDELDCADPHYLVKFARGRRTPIDQDILRAEASYYRALAQLGFDTVDVAGLRLIEGEHGPSLWQPRFDAVHDATGREVRHAMESLYALVDAGPGSRQAHETYIDALVALLGGDSEALVCEYLRRDLANLVFGNSDNHGRNTAVLRTREGMRLAPVYDFAPMQLDPEGIIRSTYWRASPRGDVDWRAVTAGLADHGRPDVFFSALVELAEALRDLPERLEALGTPEAVLTSRVGLLETEARLRRWGLLA